MVPVDVRTVACLRRKVTLDLRGMLIDAALLEIARLGGFELVYSPDLLPKGGTTRLRADELSVASALSEVLLDSGVDVVVSREDRLLLIRRGAPPKTLPGVVAGRVTGGDRGDPVSGATVALDGTRFGAITGPDGHFQIAGVPDGTYALSVRRIGYRPSVVEAKVEGGPITVDVGLDYSPTPLEEIMVTGGAGTLYEMRQVPAAISIVTADEIEALGIQRLDDLFKTLPGVSILENGQFNHFSSIMIRGGNAITYNTTAKILVDGVEMAADAAINSVDPALVERVEVFRGPQASTVYGSAAQGGIIQIVTKKRAAVRRPTPALEATVSGGVIQTRSPYGDGAVATNNQVAIVGGGDGFSYRMGVGYSREGNWIRNGFYAAPSAFGAVQLRQGPVLIEGSLHFLARRFGWLYNPGLERAAPSTYKGLNDSREMNIHHRQFFGTRILYQPSPTWTHELALGYDAQGYAYYTRSPRDTAGHQYLYTTSMTLPSLKYHMGLESRLGRWGTSSLILGFDYSRLQSPGVYWHGVGNPEEAYLPTDSTSMALTFWSYLRSHAFYGQEVFGLGNSVFLTIGVRADRQQATNVPVPYAWSARAGIAYTRSFGSLTAKVRTSFGTVPSPIPVFALQEQMYANLLTHANPAIRPPRLSGIDAGLELYFGRELSLIATHYRQRPRDQIDYVSLYADSAGYTVGQYQNVGEISNTGWEFEGRLTLGRLSISGVYSPLDGRITQRAKNYAGLLRVGDRLINVPTYSASLTAMLSVPKTTVVLTGVASGKHLSYRVFRMASDIEAGTYDPGRARERYIDDYPSFVKLNLSASREIRRGTHVFVSIKDLLNSGATESMDYFVTKSRVSFVGVRARP